MVSSLVEARAQQQESEQQESEQQESEQQESEQQSPWEEAGRGRRLGHANGWVGVWRTLRSGVPRKGRAVMKALYVGLVTFGEWFLERLENEGRSCLMRAIKVSVALGSFAWRLSLEMAIYWLTMCLYTTQRICGFEPTPPQFQWKFVECEREPFCLDCRRRRRAG